MSQWPFPPSSLVKPIISAILRWKGNGKKTVAAETLAKGENRENGGERGLDKCFWYRHIVQFHDAFEDENVHIIIEYVLFSWFSVF